MVTDETRNAVWQELLDVARLVRYYEAMADRHRRNHLVVRFVLLATAMGGVVAFFDLLPASVRLLLGAGIAGVVSWDLLSRYASKAAVLHAVSMECSLMETELRDVWLRLETMEDDEARREWLRVSRRLAEVKGWAGQAGVAEDGKLNVECAEAAYATMQEQHAG